MYKSVIKLDTHYLCSSPVFMGHKHGWRTPVTLLILVFTCVHDSVWHVASYWQWQQTTSGVADLISDNNWQSRDW